MQGGRTLLQGRAVATTTRVGYEHLLARFMEFCGANDLPMQTPNEVDIALADYFDDQYLQGESADIGSKTMAAWADKHLDYSRGGIHKLPLATRALQGWRKAAPGSSRLPLPFVLTCGIIMVLLWRRLHEHAVRTALMFTAYLRPGEAQRMRATDLVSPSLVGGKPFQSYAVIVAPREGEIPSKPGQFDDTVLLDGKDMEWVGPLLAKHRQKRPQKGPLFEFTYNEFVKAFQDAGKARGLPPDLHPYQLRHGGAAHDLLFRHRTRPEVKARGRWVTEASLRRYGKTGKVQKMIKAATPAVLQLGHQASLQLRATALGRIAPLRPPAV